jgi:hypothetical protein
MKRLCLPVACVLIVMAGFVGCSRENPFDAHTGARSPAPLFSTTPAPIATATLIAGQNIDAGTVAYWRACNVLHIEYATTGGWMLAETHLAVAGSMEEFPVTRSGNPIPGHFPLTGTHDPPVNWFEYTVDLDAMGLAEAEVLYAAAHAVVKKFDGGMVVGEESAWCEGDPFRPAPSGEKIQRKGNWGMYFTIDAAYLLWNKLGSDAEVGNSEIGPDGVITGDLDYLPCVYGNGFKPMPRTGDHNIPDNFVEYSSLCLGQQGCIEFWFHPTWNSPSVGHVVDILGYGLPSAHGDPAMPSSIGAHYNDWQNYFNLGIYNVVDGAIDYYNYAAVQFRPSTTPGWSTTEPFHLAIVWDGTAPNPNNRVQVYINDNRVGSNYYGGNPTFTGWPEDYNLRLGSRLQSGDWDRHNYEGLDGVVDNIKVWGYAKTDFSDRFEE